MTDSNYKISQSKINLIIEDVLDSIKIGIVVLNNKYFIEQMNLSMNKMLGYKQDDLKNRPIKLLFGSAEYKVLRGYIKNSEYPNNTSYTKINKLNGLRQDKTNIPLEITVYKTDDNDDQMYSLIIRDISDFNQTVENLKNLAYYDQLTKIPNRTLFRDRAETAIRIARRDDEKLAIVYIDIDEFKVINDTMGHEAGDILLKELSQRFQECVRDSDTVSRVGGDEFTILMLKITCREDASIVAERILKSNLIPVKINDQEILPKTSLGISIFPKDGDNIDMLLKNSDIAMYSAKGNGKNQFMFYKQNMIKGANQ